MNCTWNPGCIQMEWEEACLMDKTCVRLWASFQEDTPGHHIKTGMKKPSITSASPLAPGATAGEFLHSSPRQTCWLGTPASKCSQSCVLSSRRLPWIFSACFLLITETVETQPWWILANFRRSSYDSLEMWSVFKVKTDLSLHGQAFISKLSAFSVWDRLQDLWKGASLRWFPIKRHSGSYTTHLSRTAPSLPRCHVIPRKKSWEEKDEWVLSHQVVTWVMAAYSLPTSPSSSPTQARGQHTKPCCALCACPSPW